MEARQATSKHCTMISTGVVANYSGTYGIVPELFQKGRLPLSRNSVMELLGCTLNAEPHPYNENEQNYYVLSDADTWKFDTGCGFWLQSKS